MLTLNDIYCIVLALTKNNRLIFILDTLIFSIDNDISYSVMNNDEPNGCVLTQRKVFRSLEAILFIYHIVIFGVRRVRFKIYM